MKKIAIIGSKKSGKTSIAEIVIRYLTKLGFAVGAIKHIHHIGFTIDKEGSDTWRHRVAGAKVTAYLSPSEAGTILRTRGEPEKLEEVLKLVEMAEIDVVVIEGFHRLVARRTDVGKIIAFKDLDDLKCRVEGTEPPIIAFCTFNQRLLEFQYLGADCLVLPRDEEKLLRAVESFMKCP
ncbi:MAG: molybdopterin-guanine dinucleotide biosynthesis protein B [Candidatus Nezhaarchaeales archaeon]